MLKANFIIQTSFQTGRKHIREMDKHTDNQTFQFVPSHPDTWPAAPQVNAFLFNIVLLVFIVTCEIIFQEEKLSAAGMQHFSFFPIWLLNNVGLQFVCDQHVWQQLFFFACVRLSSKDAMIHPKQWCQWQINDIMPVVNIVEASSSSKCAEESSTNLLHLKLQKLYN